MGKVSTAQSPSVSWRLPTINDYKLADINGIRFVMPDMGIPGTQRLNYDVSAGGAIEISSTVNSSTRQNVWYFSSVEGKYGNTIQKSISTSSFRCVGR